MATSGDDVDRMQAAILAAMMDHDTSALSTRDDDLSRISVAALVADDALGRTVSSRDDIRIRGDGVTGVSGGCSKLPA
ncbi:MULTISPECIES: hypothetical protein [Mycobacterium]|jgi:hypothetical protein|uniref:Uncharacterized protein n=4 Tax=Mycobacterium TaxID=1763 RepID=A0A1X0KK84_MYCSC|nr:MULTISPECIES: hypothetical protein [Mycobacterium]MBX9639667.1 hypothetical protein [Mycobacteriaceae bacterium]AFC42720.1 hypothetical protein OCU_15010 [Mycobacterium intracellulare ATCC 13950]AFC47821.1 hypothetical protein OCO_14580 [Mycobacterium intracellulare MOTT-02]ASW94588.1 hypothetical protein CKJ67_07360 [Mycobacterium intracellulare]ETZ37991.1 hypothetical protein L843_1705 [Mycobacterium intracellulare MIN_061107_1834]